jgi:hypothetical protein
LIVCHDRRGWVENYKSKNRDRQDLREDAVPQDSSRDCITVNFGQNIRENVDKRKVVNGNGQGNSHQVNQLAGGGNANDGEEDVAKNNVVQEFIVLHSLAR